MKVGYKIK